MKSLLNWFVVLVILVLPDLGNTEKLSSARRSKRQLFRQDFPVRPKTPRSRAEEKDETDRTGHLPLDEHYPLGAFAEDFEGQLVGSEPHFQEISSYHDDSSVGKPHFSKPFDDPQKHRPTYQESQPIYKPFDEEKVYNPRPEYKPKPNPIYEVPQYIPKPSYEKPYFQPESFHEEPHYNLKPVHEESHYKPKPVHEESHYKPKPVHEESHYKPKPVHEESHYKPKPVHEESHYKPKPVHVESHYKPKPVHEESHYKPKPVHEESYYKPKPVHEPSHYKPKPIHEEPYHKPKPIYEELEHHGIKKRPYKKENTIPGVAGKDYPIHNKVPYTSFSCDSVPHRPGMYANPEAGCQAYHVCHDDRHGPQGASFLCTNGTLFNQKTFSCDWWYNVDCGEALSLYGLNSDPHHNPYSQKPYYEEEIKYETSLSYDNSHKYDSTFRESKPVAQFTEAIQVIQPSRKESAKQKSTQKRTLQKPISKEATPVPIERSQPYQTKKSPFDIEAKYGSFFTPFSFDSEEQTQDLSAKQETIVTKELIPHQHSTIRTKPSQPQPNKDLTPNSHTNKRPQQTQKVESSNPLPRKNFHPSENLKVEKTEDFPESKDIYSRTVSNRRKVATTQSELTKGPKVSRRQSPQPYKISPQQFYPQHKQKESSVSLTENEDFTWGDKVE